MPKMPWRSKQSGGSLHLVSDEQRGEDLADSQPDPPDPGLAAGRDADHAGLGEIAADSGIPAAGSPDPADDGQSTGQGTEEVPDQEQQGTVGRPGAEVATADADAADVGAVPVEATAVPLADGAAPDQGVEPDPAGGPTHRASITVGPIRAGETIAADEAAGTTDGVITQIAAPVVLVGNPRLGSAPGDLPRQEPVPDSILDGAKLGSVVVRAASVRGDDHRQFGDTRQDSIGLWALEPPDGLDTDDPVVLACVADGVGSQPLSQLGSARACWLLRQHVSAHLPELLGSSEAITRGCREVISEVAAGLRILAAERQVSPKQLATTLAAGLVIPAAAGAPARAVLFAVGDSTAFLLRDGSWQKCLDEANGQDQVLSTATNALPIHPGRVTMGGDTLAVGDMLVLCTDGLATPMVRNPSVRDQLAAWWGTGQAPSLPEFYWQMSFRAQTYGDDRSAVCMWLHADG